MDTGSVRWRVAGLAAGIAAMALMGGTQIANAAEASGGGTWRPSATETQYVDDLMHNARIQARNQLGACGGVGVVLDDRNSTYADGFLDIAAKVVVSPQEVVELRDDTSPVELLRDGNVDCRKLKPNQRNGVTVATQIGKDLASKLARRLGVDVKVWVFADGVRDAAGS